jgi:hypothetical protein
MVAFKESFKEPVLGLQIIETEATGLN